MINIPAIPSLLRGIPHWVCWRYVPRAGGKPAKEPVNPKTGYKADVGDKSTWVAFDKAVAYYTNSHSHLNGIGFVLTTTLPLVGADLDNCIDDSGVIEQWAQAIITDIGSYSEVSPSGHGIRIWTVGKIPVSGRRQGSIEVYASNRYLTVTGSHVTGTPNDIIFQPRMGEIFDKLFPAKPQPQTPQPNAEQVGINTGINTGVCVLDDESVLNLMFKSRHGWTLQSIWNGDNPSGDPSRDDLFMLGALAYFTGRDPVQMERLFKQSQRKRDKLGRALNKKDSTTYLSATIQKAIAGCQKVYDPSYGKKESK